MREIIIKLLLSDNKEDRDLGKEYLKKFYEEEIFIGDTKNIAVLFPYDLNRILMTNEFKYDTNGNYVSNCIILFKGDRWSRV